MFIIITGKCVLFNLNDSSAPPRVLTDGDYFGEVNTATSLLPHCYFDSLCDDQWVLWCMHGMGRRGACR